MKQLDFHSYCTSEEFKTDISQLCEKCPLTELILEGIQNQIIFQAREKQEILTPEQFKKYINDEIKNAEEAMQKIFLIERQTMYDKNDPYRKTRIKTYIWNKERIKALNQVLTLRKPLSLISGTIQKYTAKHYALTYYFELFALGKNLPLSDGGLNKKEIERIGNERIGNNGNGFYKAIYELRKTDFNSLRELKLISNNWRETVLTLSNNREE